MNNEKMLSVKRKNLSVCEWRVDMEYEVIKIKTVMSSEKICGGLRFVEGEKDIPFAIKRFYCIYETEHGMHRKFHVHQSDWKLLFCPYGKVDIIFEQGTKKETVTLDEPSKGLILHPGLRCETVWRQTSSVLCIALSEYDAPNKFEKEEAGINIEED